MVAAVELADYLEKISGRRRLRGNNCLIHAEPSAWDQDHRGALVSHMTRAA